MENAVAQGAGTGLNATYPVPRVPLGLIAPTSVTATMRPPVTPWTAGANASPVLPARDVKNFARKATGEKTATGHASAKIPISYAILYRDAFADRDLRVRLINN